MDSRYITYCFRSSRFLKGKPNLVLGSDEQDEAMGQDMILRASWKAIWGAPDRPPPVATASIRLPLLTALPHNVFWLLTSLRTLLSQAWPPPMTVGGSEEKITTGIMLFTATSPK